MEDNNLITRFHGGASIFNNKQTDYPFDMRTLIQKEDKEKIAKYDASILKNNQMIYIDGGSTTYEMIKYIKAKNISVVTNGIPHALELSKYNILSFLLCGMIQQKSGIVSGKETIRLLKGMNFDVAFMGTNGINRVSRLTTHNEYGAEIKATAIENAKKTYILKDSAKFNILC